MISKVPLFYWSKRAFDVLSSLAALIALSPLIAATYCLVLVKLGRPVLFFQTRPGRNAKVFKLVKFRTMLSPNPTKGIVSNEQRMTPFGTRLRAWSIDELPSLWNVLKGDMSLVGPRPLLVKYLPLYTMEQARRHEVRPGLTGLAQISGRNSLDWASRFELDVHYVDHSSWGMDMKILLATVSKVLRKEGINTQGYAVGSPFEGRHDEGSQ